MLFLNSNSTHKPHKGHLHAQIHTDVKNVKRYIVSFACSVQGVHI